VEDALALCDANLEAVNTREQPERVKPSPLDGVAVEGQRLRAILPPASWNLIRLGGDAIE
jgi:alpha-N-arabinofuranosidase